MARKTDPPSSTPPPWVEELLQLQRRRTDEIREREAEVGFTRRLDGLSNQEEFERATALALPTLRRVLLTLVREDPALAEGLLNALTQAKDPRAARIALGVARTVSDQPVWMVYALQAAALSRRPGRFLRWYLSGVEAQDPWVRQMAVAGLAFAPPRHRRRVIQVLEPMLASPNLDPGLEVALRQTLRWLQRRRSA